MKQATARPRFPQRAGLLVLACALGSVGPWAAAAPAGAATVQIQAAADNTLYEDAAGALSNGAGEHIFAGNSGLGAPFDGRRGLILFDIASAIPAGSTITGVTLTLNASRVTDSTPQTVRLHTASQAWGEGTSDAPGGEGSGTAATTGDATWLHTYYNTSFWTSVGGDFNATASASLSLTEVGVYNWSSAGMVADVQGWLDTPSSNFGWLIMGNESTPSTIKRFDTRENATPANRPVLSVTFDPPVPALSPGGVTLFLTLLVAGGLALRRIV